MSKVLYKVEEVCYAKDVSVKWEHFDSYADITFTGPILGDLRLHAKNTALYDNIYKTVHDHAFEANMFKVSIRIESVDAPIKDTGMVRSLALDAVDTAKYLRAGEPTREEVQQAADELETLAKRLREEAEK